MRQDSDEKIRCQVQYWPWHSLFWFAAQREYVLFNVESSTLTKTKIDTINACGGRVVTAQDIFNWPYMHTFYEKVMQSCHMQDTLSFQRQSLYIKLFGYVCMYVCLCPFGALSSSRIWLIFGMWDLWINKKDIGYAKLHYETVLRPKLRLNVAFTT